MHCQLCNHHSTSDESLSHWLICLLPLDKVPEDEWNLLYVAVTRAKRRLIMPKFLTHLLTLAGVSQDRPWYINLRRAAYNSCILKG